MSLPVPLAAAISFVLGIGVTLLYERRRTVLREREQAFLVLSGGPLPHWEEKARELEAIAVQHFARGNVYDGKSTLEAALTVRQSGRSGQ